jgi:fructose-1,6-bisphosphatase-3
VEGKDACQYILTHFGLDPKRGHIINGHIPVKLKRGESPVKGGGRLFMIDGGMSKAYQGTTGIGGYTLIYNSHNFSLAQHPVWDSLEDEPFDSPKLEVVEEHVSRQRVAETDAGARMKREITDLENLIRAYRTGQVPEPAHAPLEAQMFDPGFTFGEADSKPEEE